MPPPFWIGLVCSERPPTVVAPIHPEVFASPARWALRAGHGSALQSERVVPSSQIPQGSPGLGDPGTAPAAGPAGPGASRLGKTQHSGDPWRTHGVSAPAEAQALGGHRLGQGTRATALLDPAHRPLRPSGTGSRNARRSPAQRLKSTFVFGTCGFLRLQVFSS